MATTANANNINTPAMPSPWTAIVRGEFDTIAAANAIVTPSPLASSEPVALVASPSSCSMLDDDEISDYSNGSNGYAGRSSASWPALSQSAKPSQDSSEKSSSTYVTQITESVSSTPQKQLSHHVKPNFTSSDTMPARQRPFKRNSIDSTSNSQPPGSQPQTGNLHLKNSPRDNSQRNSQSRNSIVHPQQQHNSIRRNGGLHSNRNFNGRDAHMQSQRAVPSFMSHPQPPLPTQFIGLPQFRAFAPVMYPVAGPPDSRTTVPYFVAPIPHALYLSSPDPDIQLHSKIVNQIDYYFSNENLIKDTFLRRNMDEQGFVPVKLIAGFKKVSHLTDNIQLILDAIQSSTIVEVQGDKGDEMIG